MADAGVTRRRLLAGVVAAAALAIVWLASSELPDIARLWTAVLMVVFPATMLLQARDLRAGLHVPRGTMYAISNT